MIKSPVNKNEGRVCLGPYGVGVGEHSLRKDLKYEENSRALAKHVLVTSFMLVCRFGFLHRPHSAKWLQELHSGLSAVGMIKTTGNREAVQQEGDLFVLEFQVVAHYCREASHRSQKQRQGHGSVFAHSLAATQLAFSFTVQGPAHDMVLPTSGSSHLS